MPKDALLNSGALEQPEVGSFRRVSEMQAKLHRWASADPGRRFDDLFNLVHDPATLRVAWERVASNTGARTAGSDGVTVARIEREIGALEFLRGIRIAVKDGSFRPQPVRERLIPKPGWSGKVRRLGIPTVTDRVVQAALKLVLEPIFEADFHPVSFGFRPKRRAHDAIADIHLFGSRGYEWVLDADIEACFDTIDHVALLDRVRARVTDKRVLTLVKSFLKAGILTELGEERDTPTGTPQGGILSPLLANIALSVLDEYLHRDWRPGGWMSTEIRRHRHRRLGLPTWRLVRYADDFVVMVFGTRDHVVALREEVSQVLAPMGLRLSPAKTRIVHIRDGFDFLGFRIRRRIKKGTRDQWRLYTFIGDRPLPSLKARIRALTRRTSQQDLRSVLIRINRITHGWAEYFRHAVAKHTFDRLAYFIWWRIVRWVKTKRRWRWKDIHCWLRTPTGWRPIAADGIELRNIAATPVTRYRRRSIPSPWPRANPA